MIILTGIFIFISSSAFAKSYSFPGLYVVASIGYVKHNTDTTGLTITSEDDSGTGFSFGIGYEFNKYIAVETGLLDLGQTTISSSSTINDPISGLPLSFNLTEHTETDGFYFGSKLSYPVVKKVEAYIKAGVYFWDVGTVSYGCSSFTPGPFPARICTREAASSDGNDLYYGLGMSYDITEVFTLRTGWTRYQVTDNDVDVFAAGIAVNLGKL